MLNQNIGISVIHLPTCPSTNSYLRDQIHELDSGTCVYTSHQSSGRGQLNNVWYSSPNLNLTASFLLKNIPLHTQDQFVLSMICSLAIVRMLEKEMDIQAQIKWPNDILVNKKKIAGILIENGIHEQKIAHSIIGIGLNINEKEFPNALQSASSLYLISSKEFDIQWVLEKLITYLNVYYQKYFVVGKQRLEEEYLSFVYGFGAYVEIEEQGIRKHVKVAGIDTWGRLKTKQPDGVSGCYDLKEIKFIY